MALITRRQFVQQTAFSACALYGLPFKAAKATKALEQSREKPAETIDPAAIRRLASKITGHVITPDASDYESARQVNNHAFNRHPALIVRCASPTDLARSLDFGRMQSLPVAVRCGGHSSAGFGVCEGGVMIDLAGMRRVQVDVQKRIARAEAGCLVADVDQATQRFGLATVLGGCPTVGIGGLTLGGGIGTLTPKYGAACDNIQSAEVVTVDSRQVEASHNSNSDLFWAIRGGGGNFGVATSFEYRLYPVTEVLAGALEYRAGGISELLRTYQKFTAMAPDEIMLVAMILSSKQGPIFRIPFRYCGASSVGNQLLRSLREPIKPEEDTVRVMSYLEAQATEFPQPPKPLPYVETSLFLPELNEPVIAAITTAIRDAPQRMRVMMWHLHGAVTRVPIGEMAFPLRASGHALQLRGDWDMPGEEASARQWTKALRAVLDPFSRGMYVNHLSEPSDNYIRAAYGPNYGRLAEIKKKYDPTNVLELNPNIKPA
jgi:FAD binding domain-containing protein/berberine-like enzyme